MIEVSESEGRERLLRAIDEGGYTVSDPENASLGQLVTMACHAVSGATVAWCVVCDQEQQFCICDDEESKQKERERQMMSEKEKEELREATIEQLRDRLSDEEVKELKSKKPSDIGFCDVCDQKRFKKLLVETENGDRIGCTFCLEITDKNEENENGR